MENNPVIKPIITTTLLIFFSFIVLFFLGLNIALIVYKKLFGEPYEMGWLLLSFMGQISGVSLGLLGSLITSIVLVVKKVRDNKKPKAVQYSVLKVMSISWILVLILVIATFIIAGVLIPNCPNCPR